MLFHELLCQLKHRLWWYSLGKEAEYNLFIYNQAKKLNLKRCKLLSAAQLKDILEKTMNYAYEVAKCTAPGQLLAHLIHSRSTACTWKIMKYSYKNLVKASSWTALISIYVPFLLQTRDNNTFLLQYCIVRNSPYEVIASILNN